MNFFIRVKKAEVEIVEMDGLEMIENESKKVYSEGLNKSFFDNCGPSYSKESVFKYFNDADIDSFILLIIDKKCQCVEVYNDHFGSQEIYYKDDSYGFEISSSIFDLDPETSKINRNALYEIILFQGVLPPDTVYKNINIVPAANYCFFTHQEITISDYWDVNSLLTKKENSYDDLVAKGRSALIDTIRSNSSKRTITSLSGGIDSGGLLGMYKQVSGLKRPKAVSIGPYGKGSGDLVSARKSAFFNGAEVVEVYPEFSDLNKLWDWMQGTPQPICSNILLPHNLLHIEAKKQQTDSMLYGFGAEMLLGNLKIARMAELLWWEKLVPNSLLKLIYKITGKIFIKSDTHKAFLLSAGNWTHRFMLARGPYFPWLKKYFIYDAEDFWSYVYGKMNYHFDNRLSVGDSLVKLYVKSWVNYLQSRDMGILGRPFGIRPVIPFDSVRLAKVFFRVPTKHRRKNNWNKQLIRDIMRPYVADHLYSNPVKSMVLPYQEFFKGREDKIIEYLKTSKITGDLFDYDSLLDDYKKLPEGGYVLMHTLGLAVWYDANFKADRKQKFNELFSN